MKFSFQVYLITGVILFSTFKSIAVKAQDPFFINYTLKTGLPSNTVYYAMRDSKGFLWFGTDAGVCRYDGLTFKKFTPQDGLSDNEIFQLIEDSKERIWFLTFNGQLSYYKEGRFYNASIDSTLRAMRINGLFSCAFEDSKKNLWFGVLDNSIIIRKENESIRKHLQLPDFIMHIWQDKDYVMVLGGNGIFKFDVNDTENYTYTKLPDLNLAYDASRKFSVDTAANIIYCPNRTGGMYVVNYNENVVRKELIEIFPMGIRILTTGKKYVYPERGSFCWSDTNNDEPDTREPILPAAKVSYILEDHEGGMWFTTLNKGIYYTPSLTIRRITRPPGNTQEVNHVAGGNGKAWFFYPDGQYSIVDDGFTMKTYPAIYPAGNRVEQVTVEGDTAWLALSPGGVLRINNDKRETYFSELSIKSFMMAGDSLWISAGPAGLRQYLNSGLGRTHKPKFIFSARSFGVYADTERQRIWFGTQQGLALRDKATTSYLGYLHPYLNNRISKIQQDREGTTWVLVEATGLVAVSNAKAIAGVLDKNNWLDVTQCKEFFIDDDDTVWFITNNVLGQIIRKENGLVINSILRFNIETLNDVWADHQHVWLASDHGVIVIPKTLRQPHETKIEVTGIYINDQYISASTQKTIRVNHTANNVLITFSGISFVSRSDNYRYKVYEHEATWKTTKLAELKFPSLPPGNYYFQVQAQNTDGTWSKETIGIRLIIEHPFWQMWWFMASVLIFILSLATFIIWKAYQVNYRKVVLHDRLVESELKALTAQMNPHFIFNTLNTIQRYYMTSETKVANKLLSRFSALMRTILENTSKSFVSLEEEIVFLKNYLEIEQTRFNNKFSYAIHVDESINAGAYMIPSMIIQPFVENAIIHGLTGKQGLGEVKISFERLNSQLKIAVDDNGIGRKVNNPKNHTSRGINLIQERLNILSAKNKTAYQLRIIDKQGTEQGTTVELYLQIK